MGIYYGGKYNGTIIYTINDNEVLQHLFGFVTTVTLGLCSDISETCVSCVVGLIYTSVLLLEEKDMILLVNFNGISVSVRVLAPQ